MTKQLNSHMFEETYDKMDIDLDKLGCVMLDVEPRHDMLTPMTDQLYISPNKSRQWLNGWVCGEEAHVTLLYGLMENANNWEPHVERVLRDWDMKTVEIDHVGFFESTYEDEEYYCIVAHIKVTEKLLEGHERLEFLPHINTFTGYKPHMTICYIKKDENLRRKLLKEMNDKWMGKRLSVKPKINLGYKPE